MGRSRGMEFCCCAIPLVNAGAYFLILEAAFIAIVVAILALAPPSIVATMGAIPSWSKSLVAALGFITFFWQAVGVFSVAKQKTSLYRIYIRINLLLTLIIIACTLAFFAVAAAKHSTTLNVCEANFGATPAGDGSGLALTQATSALDGTGRKICNIFIWVQVGVMGGLLILMSVTQLYMCFAQRAYGYKQREAATMYKSADPYSGPGDHIPLAARDSGVWEPRDEYYPATRQGGDSHYDTPSHEPQGYDRYDDDDDHAYAGRPPYNAEYSSYGQGAWKGENRY